MVPRVGYYRGSLADVLQSGTPPELGLAPARATSRLPVPQIEGGGTTSVTSGMTRPADGNSWNGHRTGMVISEARPAGVQALRRTRLRRMLLPLQP
jgi:hypothetical protein